MEPDSYSHILDMPDVGIRRRNRLGRMSEIMHIDDRSPSRSAIRESLNTPPPPNFNPYAPDQASLRALECIKTLTGIHEHDPATASHLRQFWPRICVWMTVFIKKMILDQPAITKKPSIDFRERLICVSHGVSSAPSAAASQLGLSYEDLLDSEETPTFLPLMIELCVHLAQTSNPYFELIWSQLLKLSLKPITKEYFRSGFLDLHVRYDLPRIYVQLLIDETGMKEVDPYIFDATITLITWSCDFIPGMRYLLLSKHVVKWLTYSLVCIARQFDNSRPGDIFMVCNFAVRCLDYLQTCFGDGFTWVIETVDSGLIPASLKLVRSPLMHRKHLYDRMTSTCLDVMKRKFVANLPEMKPYLCFRSVLNRVLKQEKIVFAKVFDSRDQAAKKTLDEFFDYGHTLKDIMSQFDAIGSRNLCANKSCKQGSIAPDLVTLKRCAACRVVIYCSHECQRTDWKAAHGHKIRCKALQPETRGHSYRVSTLDEAFFKFCARREIDAKREKLRLVPGASSREDPLVVQFDLRKTPFTVTPRSLHSMMVDIPKTEEYKSVRNDLLAWRKRLKRSDVLVQVQYPGRDSQARLVYSEEI